MSQEVILKNKKIFKELLNNYEVSSDAKNLLKTINFVAIAGMAGGGRNTVINYLVMHANYHFVVSDTTRPPKVRDGVMEVDGVNYFFRSEEDMLNDIKDGRLLEAELIHNQQVSGTSIRELEKAKLTGKIPMHDFEYGGAENVHKASPEAHIIGLLPPSYTEWEKRFRGREIIHDQEFINRLQTAEVVLSHMLSKPYFKLVINDSVEQCAKDIRAIVERGEYSDRKAAEAHSIAEEILSTVKLELKNTVR